MNKSRRPAGLWWRKPLAVGAHKFGSALIKVGTPKPERQAIDAYLRLDRALLKQRFDAAKSKTQEAAQQIVNKLLEDGEFSDAAFMKYAVGTMHQRFILPALFVIDARTAQEAEELASQMQAEANFCKDARERRGRAVLFLDEKLPDKVMEIPEPDEEELPHSYQAVP